MTVINSSELEEIFDDIILGRGVKRAVHHLEYDQNVYVDLFAQRLRIYNYQPLVLSNISLKVGFRLPAFLVSEKAALFGYVFWEVFSEHKKRKIWGSVIRNKKGDWKYILPGYSNQVIFANLSRHEPIDINYLS